MNPESLVSTKNSNNIRESSNVPKNSIYEKCILCKKKVMFHSKCKCSNYYCPTHLHQHECSYSHFMTHKTKLEKSSIKIQSEKLVRI